MCKDTHTHTHTHTRARTRAGMKKTSERGKNARSLEDDAANKSAEANAYLHTVSSARLSKSE